MVRGFVFVLMAIVVMLASAMFAHKNPGTIEIDLITGFVLVSVTTYTL